MTARLLSLGLAYAFLDGEWTLPAMRARAQLALEARPRWLRPLCLRVLKAFPAPPAEADDLAAFIARDHALPAEWQPDAPRVRRWFVPETRMARVEGPPAAFAVPAIASTGALAEALGVPVASLQWFADVQQRNLRVPEEALRHYRFRWLAKRSGGYRLLETPKPRIKRIQRWLLRSILANVPPESSAHGFVSRRSVLSFVAPHVGQRVVLRLDLEDFFATITLARVRAIFLRLGYPRRVAQALACLCCTASPESVLRASPERDPRERFTAIQRLRDRHLPQGAPTSPALSNLVAYRLDRRLAGLARKANVQYTRYADDLAFSGNRELDRSVDRFIARVGAIVIEEGFRIRFRKIRVMRSGARQQLGGLVVNARANVPRRAYDSLRAELCNAARHGADSQNRANLADYRAHLQGRIAWIAATHSKRAERLRSLFDRIDWSR
jgi:hypothetical protein